LAFVAKNIALFLGYNLDSNQIGNAGEEYLSKANWPNLVMLTLSINNIAS
jgi:hypothetical protein